MERTPQDPVDVASVRRQPSLNPSTDCPEDSGLLRGSPRASSKGKRARVRFRDLERPPSDRGRISEPSKPTVRLLKLRSTTNIWLRYRGISVTNGSRVNKTIDGKHQKWIAALCWTASTHYRMQWLVTAIYWEYSRLTYLIILFVGCLCLV